MQAFLEQMHPHELSLDFVDVRVKQWIVWQFAAKLFVPRGRLKNHSILHHKAYKQEYRPVLRTI